jgi:hypothetical protein
MSLLKIELDLPEFEKELNISITIKKDGEVVYSASSPSGNVEVEEKVKEEPAPKTKKKSSGKASGGNFMNLDL